ncbi:hypothetical protein LTR91_002609 [Friedmanniomyces endolithicus]|uniref:Uncharacterized protein n=1 Tax=Friedmanniomyces endolithicus TaxID=329885 RepID=A0AAN6FQU2_9PEZI|nr:hypothetical protein LTR35_004600 [Friedmanniomyces endolithicus]KAK0299067.1 hypothetical protein LTS00_002177 [Friedmanniomyces endolithicus]KAK0306831.1 hypothetical protein LTR01_006127 [Friedmanniomyces endolithicus]KAK0322834.1 hypothetical protein LTR82_006291 [Friedmanniomyces endolithicus]KAK0834015.1 hypothetical protein LTR73_001778 [Friedmanniomyces endolithicus]
MRSFTVLTAILATALAFPQKRTTTITAADILTIDPATSSCANAPIAPECRTAAQAAPYIAISFANFGITSFGEQAALLALMLYESGDFKYAQNHFPGVPGQGTRNMQSPAYNLKYAEYLATVQQASAQGPAALLALVNTEEWSFGSAAWYLVTQCGEGVRQGLAAGTQEGWEAYLQCVGTSADEKRDALWNVAMGLKQW